MEKRSRKGVATRERILEVSLELFNELGYARTSVARIAREAGMAVGNLCYHFPAKKDLATELMAQLGDQLEEGIEFARRPGPEVEVFVAFGYRTIETMWDYRFVMRDRMEYGAGVDGVPDLARAPIAAAHFVQMRALLERIREAGLLGSHTVDLDVLVTNIWMVSRYWWQHLDEHEGITSPTREDHDRAFVHVLSMLDPFLTAAGRRKLTTAAEAAARLSADSVPGR